MYTSFISNIAGGGGNMIEISLNGLECLNFSFKMIMSEWTKVINFTKLMKVNVFIFIQTSIKLNE